MTVHPIEAESYRILASRIDLTHLDSGVRAVVERVIHASADLEFASTMRVDAASVARGVSAIAGGAPVVVDAEMVRAGITGSPTVCLLSSAVAGPDGFPTRSAMAIRAAAELYDRDAVWVIGNAPTALMEVIALIESGDLAPALVIGLPVGFVGAAQSKQALRDLAGARHLATITNVGEKGGSAVAAAAFNALARLAVGLA